METISTVKFTVVGALVVASDGLTHLFVAAGLLSLCAAVMTRLLHRPGYPTIHLPR